MVWRALEKHILAAFFILCASLTGVTILLANDIIFEIRRCQSDIERDLAIFKSYADDAYALMTDPHAISMRRSDFLVMIEHIFWRNGYCELPPPSRPSNSTV